MGVSRGDRDTLYIIIGYHCYLQYCIRAIREPTRILAPCNCGASKEC